MNIIDDVNSGKAQLVDVRSKLEWKMGHAKGATHLALNRILSGDTGDLDPERPVFVYCASGARSSQAESYLKHQGFTVTNIGGLNSWAQLGGAVVR